MFRQNRDKLIFGLSLALGVSLVFNIYFLTTGSSTRLAQDSDFNSGKGEGGLVSLFKNVVDSQLVKSEDNLNKKDLEWLFGIKDYPSALEGLSIFFETEPSKAKKLNQAWMNEMYSLLQLGRLEDVELFLIASKEIFPENWEYRVLEAKWNIARGEFLLAINQLYRFVRTLPENSQYNYRQSIREWLLEEYAKIKGGMNQSDLAVISERLVKLDSRFIPYIILYAEQLIAQKNYRLAKAELEPLAFDSIYGRHIGKVLDKIALLEQGGKVILLKPVGAHYIVEGKINDNKSVSLMLDTGASLSVLSREAFSRMQSHSPAFIKKILVNTAGGEVTADLYEFDSFQLDDYQLKNFVFAVLDYNSGSNTDGLLGMNYLNNFDFKIDQEKNRLLLSPQQ